MRSRADTPLLRSPLAILLALIAAATLLVCFTNAVHQVVQQAAERHLEDGARADAAWRCNLSKGALARDECMGSFESIRIASRALTR